MNMHYLKEYFYDTVVYSQILIVLIPSLIGVFFYKFFGISAIILFVYRYAIHNSYCSLYIDNNSTPTFQFSFVLNQNIYGIYSVNFSNFSIILAHDWRFPYINSSHKSDLSFHFTYFVDFLYFLMHSQCNFCLYPLFEPKKYRIHREEKIITYARIHNKIMYVLKILK